MSVFRKQTMAMLVMAVSFAIGTACLQPVFALTPDETAGISTSLLGDGTTTNVSENVKNLMAAAVASKYSGLSGANLEAALAKEMTVIFNAYVAANNALPTPMNMEQLASLFSAGASFAIDMGIEGLNMENIITNFIAYTSVGLVPGDAVQFQAGAANGRTVGQRVALRAKELGIDPQLQDLLGRNAAGQLVVSMGFVRPDGQVEAYGTEETGGAGRVTVTRPGAGKIGENNNNPSPT